MNWFTGIKKQGGVSMICPRCDEGTLRKIQFITTKKYAYLCDACDSFWFINEQIGYLTGHTLEAFAKENVPDIFEYVDEKDKEQMQIKDERDRLSHGKI